VERVCYRGRNMPKRVVGLLESSGPVNDTDRDIEGVARPNVRGWRPTVKVERHTGAEPRFPDVVRERMAPMLDNTALLQTWLNRFGKVYRDPKTTDNVPWAAFRRRDRLQGRQAEIHAARDRKLEQARQRREQAARSQREKSTSPSSEKVA
jgi:hypothetical protein